MVSLRARLTRLLLSMSEKIPWTAKPRFPTIDEASTWSPEAVRQVIEQRRVRLERLAKRSPTPLGTECQAVDADLVRGEWVAAPGVRQSQAVLYLHGGGYYAGSVRTHRCLAAHISREADARVLLVDYRLAPENPFPAAVEDAVRAYRRLLGQGLSPERMALAGDSAGGGLAVAALLALKGEGERLPSCAVCLSPWLDLALTGQSLQTKASADPTLRASDLPFVARMYLGSSDSKTPTASPLYGDLADLPPILIQIGADEILIDDALRFAERARRRGVSVRLEVWEGMFHVWQAYMRFVPEARRAIAKIGEFLRATWGSSEERSAPTAPSVQESSGSELS